MSSFFAVDVDVLGENEGQHKKFIDVMLVPVKAES